MRPTPFAYLRASTPDQVLTQLVSDPSGTVLLAGGQSLVPQLRDRCITPTTVLDIGGVDAWSHVRRDQAAVTLGALVRIEDIRSAAELGESVGLLAEAIGLSADPHVRNMATLGGAAASASHFSPMGRWGALDIGCALLCLHASVTLLDGTGRTQTLPVEDFLALRQSEQHPRVVTEIRIQSQHEASWHYEKLAFRGHSWPVLSAAVIRRDDEWSVAVSGRGLSPTRLTEVEQVLQRGGSLEEAASVAQRHVGSLVSDVYLHQVSSVIVLRSLRAACAE